MWTWLKNIVRDIASEEIKKDRLLMARTWTTHRNALHNSFWHNVRMLRVERDRAERKAAIAMKFAERAFSLASTATISIAILQKALPGRPLIVAKAQQLKEQVAKDEISLTLAKGAEEGSGFDWMYSALTPEEQDMVDKVIEHNSKYRQNNSGGNQI
jgi:hypothetical protein